MPFLELLRFPCWFYFFSDLNMTFKFHADNTIPSGDWIWVFASNEAGKHGKGQARIARVNFRAEFGVGRGPTGHAYAIATHDRHLELLPLAAIENSIGDFLSYARIHSELNFFVTRVACKGSSGGANGSSEVGYSNDQIGPLFARAPENCSLPDGWRLYVSQARAQAPLPASVVLPAAEPEHSRCPFCGHWTFADLVEAPQGACTHVVLRSA